MDVLHYILSTQFKIYTCILHVIMEGNIVVLLIDLGPGILYVTPHHQMRHKSQIQKMRFLNNVIEDNTSFKMVKELCLYHNQKLNYNLQYGLYSGVVNKRNMGLKIALSSIPMLIYIKVTYSQ